MPRAPTSSSKRSLHKTGLVAAAGGLTACVLACSVPIAALLGGGALVATVLSVVQLAGMAVAVAGLGVLGIGSWRKQQAGVASCGCAPQRNLQASPSALRADLPGVAGCGCAPQRNLQASPSALRADLPGVAGCDCAPQRDLQASPSALRADLPVACDPLAIPSGDRQKWVDVAKALYACVDRVREEPDGYIFRLPRDQLPLVAEYIERDSRCCSFFEWHVIVEQAMGPVRMRVVGPQGSKQLIRQAISGVSLLQPAVAAEIGIDSRAARPLTLETAMQLARDTAPASAPSE